MGAAFPNGVASFSTKKDQTDINFANDINRLQDEIVAIEESIGPAFNQITILQTEETQLQSGLAGQVQQEQTDFQNLQEALLYAMTGQWMPCAQTWTPGGQMIPAVDGGFAHDPSENPTTITLLAPGSDTDPDAMWNGTGFTLRRSGFWVIEGFVTFLNHTSANGFDLNNNIGKYESCLIMNNSIWNAGNDKKEVSSHRHLSDPGSEGDAGCDELRRCSRRTDHLRDDSRRDGRPRRGPRHSFGH